MTQKARINPVHAAVIQVDPEQEALLQAMTSFGSALTQNSSPSKKKRLESPINPVTKTDENAADDVLYAISNLGIPRELEADWEGSTDRNSRFWYRPTISLSADVERRKRAVAPKEAKVVLDAIEERAVAYSTELPPELDANLAVVREFWLKEIAPLTLAAQAGADHARSVVTTSLGADVDSTPFVQSQKMLMEAAKIKTAKFWLKYMGLDSEHLDSLLNSVAPKGPLYVPVPSPDADRRSRPETKLKPKPEPESKSKSKEEALQ